MSDPTGRDSIWALSAEQADPRQLDAYDYDLGDERIASEPAHRRDRSRLLVYRGGDDELEETRFHRLATLLDPEDLLVFNDTRVVPARLEVFKQTGGRVELFVTSLTEDPGAEGWRDASGETVEFDCMTRSSRPVRPGMVLSDDDRPELPQIEVLDAKAGRATVRVRWEDSPLAFLERFGQVPLPPYIVKRRTEKDRPPVVDEDRHRYQTVYADRPGAVAAPTAGLHFTDEVFEQLDRRGIRRARLTLTVGPGTFQPVREDELADHDMHSERYRIPPALGDAVDACRHRGGRVVAVGTTTARALESEARREQPFRPGARSTDLFLRPGADFRVCDGLITNFHLPRSTLLALVAAFIGYKPMRRLYEAAVGGDYRFYSYGDANLLLPR